MDLRIDPLRGWATRISPRRGARPVDPSLEAGTAAPDDPGDCPFCPGREDALGEIVAQEPGAAGPAGSAGDPESDPFPAGDSPHTPWRTRAVLNRYPFLEPGEGIQEVLVDTPRHGVTLASMTTEERRAALGLYRSRLRAGHAAVPGGEAHLFRNQGRAAGSSRAHPHGQLVVVRAATPARRALEERLARAVVETTGPESGDGSGGCLLCRPVPDARRVWSGEHFTVRTLQAPLDPCHLRVVPWRHGPSFAGTSDAALDELAGLLGRLAGLVARQVGHEEHNLLFHDHGGAGREDAAAFHWHLEFRPRVTRLAGFEQMSGVGVCPTDPEADARALRRGLDALGRF